MLDDKYRIEHLVAEGGMGAVYAGTHVKLRKRVAIKLLNPQLTSPMMIERFHREAITASQIGHEGIAQVTDIGTSQAGEPFLVMEFLEGESLASRLKKSGPMPLEDACELACAILSPLAAAHRAGIVHRDLKPDNVFLVRQSRGEMVKLLDFGISRAAGLEAEFRLTTTGLVLGTPYYMSPEQARGELEITPAADLYAIGVILYEMLIGAVPIHADNYNQLMYRVMMGEYPRPRERRADLPERLEQLILQAMSIEPEHRPRSASDLEQALAPFCKPSFRDRLSMSSPALYTGGFGGAHTGGVVHPALATPPPAQRSRWPWIAGGAIALVIAGGAIALVTGQRGLDEPVAARPVEPPPKVALPPPPPKVAEPAPPAPPPPPKVAEPAPATITIKLTVDAPNATITIDGHKLKDGELTAPRDDQPHALHITAPGRVAHDERLKFDESQRLQIQLPRAGHGPAPKPRDHDVITSESPY